MTRVANSVGIQNAPTLVGRSPYEVLIVASMIEKEAKVDEDRALIARVIYNRLFVGTPLQIDATLYYGQDSSTPFSTLQSIDTPYNTYLHLGLPPTPITNPARSRSRPRCTPRRTRTRRRAPVASPASGSTTCGGQERATRLRHHVRGPPEERREGPGGRTARVSRPAAPALAISGRTRVAGIIGSPVAHSLSPAMHNAAFAACGLDWRYVAFEVRAGGAGGALEAVRPSAWPGCR